MHYVNEHGIDIVIFNNLVRGEFHFEPVSNMSAIRSWVKEDGWPEAARMFVKDNTGELTSHLEYIAGPGPNRMTEENVAFLWNSFLNWFVFGINLLKRGEYIRSQVILFILQGYLLWLARVQENSTTHWLTPSKNAEKDLSAATLARYKECTASVEPKELEQAYIVAFNWGIEAARDLSTKYRLDLHDKLIQIINDRLLRIQQHLV